MSFSTETHKSRRFSFLNLNSYQAADLFNSIKYKLSAYFYLFDIAELLFDTFFRNITHSRIDIIDPNSEIGRIKNIL